MRSRWAVPRIGRHPPLGTEAKSAEARRFVLVFSQMEVQRLIDDLLEEAALSVGGLVAIHEVDDKVVASLFSSLRIIRRRLIERLDAESATKTEIGRRHSAKLEPHPMIQEFLDELAGREL